MGLSVLKIIFVLFLIKQLFVFVLFLMNRLNMRIVLSENGVFLFFVFVFLVIIPKEMGKLLWTSLCFLVVEN